MARKKETSFDVAQGFDFSDNIEQEPDTSTRVVNSNKTNGPVQKENLAKKKRGRPEGTVIKKEEEKAKHFSTSLPPDVIDKLNKQAQIEDRNISKIVAKAIIQYVENYNKNN